MPARPPPSRPARLVHGTFHDRNVLDLGGGVGVIDWQRCGQGPVEIDAAMFLTTIWRTGLSDAASNDAAARAQQSFLSGTAGILDDRVLSWHRAATMLHLATKEARRRANIEWQDRARALLGEAGRLAETAA